MAIFLKNPENQRVQQEFKLEALDTTLTVHTDSDWAGCKSSRKSTSGGVASSNIGVVKYWSSAQRLGGVVVVRGTVLHHQQGGSRGHGNQELGRRHMASRSTSCSEPTQVLHWELSTGVASERRATLTQELRLQNAIRNREMQLQKVAGERTPRKNHEEREIKGAREANGTNGFTKRAAVAVAAAAARQQDE